MKYWGKYRGKVIATNDPIVSGRLLCTVAALPGMKLNWATPCVPYASIGQGFFALPIEGSDVWIEFEGGEPDKPIWSGGYWEPREEPVMPEIDPLTPELINILRSKFCTLLFNDTPDEGGVTVSATGAVASVSVTMTLNDAGFSVTCGELSLTINPKVGIKLTAGETVMTLTAKDVSVNTPKVDVTADSVKVTSPTTNVRGDVDITGAVQVGGETNIAGALTVEGETNIAGALTVEVETNIAGALTVEGETNIAGALTVEGDCAVLGLIEGDVVPLPV